MLAGSFIHDAFPTAPCNLSSRHVQAEVNLLVYVYGSIIMLKAFLLIIVAAVVTAAPTPKTTDSLTADEGEVSCSYKFLRGRECYIEYVNGTIVQIGDDPLEGPDIEVGCSRSGGCSLVFDWGSLISKGID